MKSFVLILYLLSNMGCHSSKSAQQSFEIDQASILNAKIVLVLKNQLTTTMKDPDSVRFSHTVLYIRPEDHTSRPNGVDEMYSLCGQFNAKNSFGGYVGYRPFSSTIFVNSKTHTLQNFPKLVLTPDITARDVANRAELKWMKEHCEDPQLKILQSQD